MDEALLFVDDNCQGSCNVFGEDWIGEGMNEREGGNV